MQEERLSIHKDNSDIDNHKAIVDVVSFVEWADVHKCMELLDWEWYSTNGVPSVQDLIRHATTESERQVNNAIKSKRGTITSCGGIQIRTHYFEDGSIALTVQFVLTEWDNYL